MSDVGTDDQWFQSSDLGQQKVAIHLQQYVDSGRINRWAIPREVQIVDETPKTGIGKIDKKGFVSW